MGMLTRFSEIISSNINAVLDKLEDPKKMIDQLLRDMASDLAEVRQETAVVMAEEARCKRIYDKLVEDVAKYEGLAMKAVTAGNDQDAMVFLGEKKKAETQMASALTTYELAKSNSSKMRQMHDKLTADLNELRVRKESIKATISVAETQKKMNKMTGLSAANNMGKLEGYAARAQKMLDEANAEAELGTAPVNEADVLAEKYDSKTSAVSDDLAALKAKMGL